MPTQSLFAKKSSFEEFRSKNLKLANEKVLALPYINEPKKISRSNKKKEYFKKKQDRKNFILATKDNTIEDEKKQNN